MLIHDNLTASIWFLQHSLYVSTKQEREKRHFVTTRGYHAPGQFPAGALRIALGEVRSYATIRDQCKEAFDL